MYLYKNKIYILCIYIKIKFIYFKGRFFHLRDYMLMIVDSIFNVTLKNLKVLYDY
jgi:hypothetical protein